MSRLTPRMRSGRWIDVVDDVHFKQRLVTEISVAEKVSARNIYNRLKNVYSAHARDEDTLSRWALRIAGFEKGQADVSDARGFGHYFLRRMKGDFDFCRRYARCWNYQLIFVRWKSENFAEVFQGSSNS